MARAAGTAHGKVVAITGAARGIGFATARRLVEDGAKVAIADVDEIALKTAVGELGVTTYAVADVTDPDSFGAFLDLVERELGPLDVLVNNAGIMPIGYVPGCATYCASKHAVKGLTESLRREYRGSGVDFSQVQPTFTNTELITGTSGTKGMRNAEPHEVAEAVASLIVKPRPVVRVTRWARFLAASQNVIPRRVGETVGRALGAEKAFTHVDSAAREAYEDRISSV